MALLVEKTEPGLRLEKFSIVAPKSEVMDIRNPTDVETAVGQAKQGVPFGFAGMGVYGFGGTKEGIIKAAELKTEAAKALGSTKFRNLEKEPPVCLPSWPLLHEATDWRKLAGKRFEPEELSLFFHQLYFRYPSHFVVPLEKDFAAEFLHPKMRSINGEQAATYAFVFTGINYELQRLIEAFEKKCQSPMFVMSANPTGEKSITRAGAFMESFPGIPILTDPLMEEAFSESSTSHPMIDATPLSTTGQMAVIRKTKGHPILLETAIEDFGWQNKIKVVDSPDVTILTGDYIRNISDLAGMIEVLYDFERPISTN
ncbi:hypothetical protein ACFL0Y_00655 [Patescibacteria group bacterium]